jgi:D-3-phosphoglycerate dehydrogenase
MHVTRWGQSAYESDADLSLEAMAAHALGWTWSAHPDVRTAPDLAATDVLVVTSKVLVDASLLAGTPVRHVLTTTSGYDHIDVAAVRALGVAVGRSPQARRDCVVEHALGALLALGKQWPIQVRRARDGIWCRKELPNLSPLGLRGATVLVVGQGVIGRQMNRVLQVLGAHVLAVDPAGVADDVEAVALDDGLGRCDAVTLHCSLTPSSRGLLSRDRLARLGHDAVVVNTARGESMDVQAAVEAVHAGRLRGLAVDVFPTEPWPELAEPHPAIWFTPHGAGYAPDLGTRVAREVAATLQAIATGRPHPAPVCADA